MKNRWQQQPHLLDAPHILEMKSCLKLSSNANTDIETIVQQIHL